ncbi:uracil-DNA glycosylase [Candidatus Marinimicrobia bacterium MT.SAG.3]|nr:uracil-DNA glycosylase [Candidatus Marinimicrobia bacterium MT.SAG.3]TFB12638.1 uracil-DNA glycosylase [Candidatus Marinimicrobia bacterium MT.SAG.4]
MELPLDGKLLKNLPSNGNKATSKDLESFYNEIKECQLCPLGATRTKFVFGVGNPNADLMLIGEAPGRNEDLQGEPFVGRAGQLLDKILAAIDLSREEVYIANVLKCRPPNNRDPLKSESDTCQPYLKQQIELIKPKLILALGRVSGAWLLGEDLALKEMRNNSYRYNGIEMMVTYHPAALLRNPNWKKPCWEDMQKVRDRVLALTQPQGNS